MTDRAIDAFFGVCVPLLVGQGVYCGFVGWAHYSVWSNEMWGKAAMAYADSQRQVKALEAQASLDAAKLLALAEVERAKRAAESNRIVAEGLGGPEGYLRYIYIQQLGNSEKNERTVIYEPTEGMLPITEAGRVARPHAQ